MDIKGALTEKLGPLPAWGWIGIGVVGYFFLFRKKSQAGSQGISYVMSYVPQSGSGGGSSDGGGGPPITNPIPSPPQQTPPPRTLDANDLKLNDIYATMALQQATFQPVNTPYGQALIPPGTQYDPLTNLVSLIKGPATPSADAAISGDYSGLTPAQIGQSAQAAIDRLRALAPPPQIPVSSSPYAAQASPNVQQAPAWSPSVPPPAQAPSPPDAGLTSSAPVANSIFQRLNGGPLNGWIWNSQTQAVVPGSGPR